MIAVLVYSHVSQQRRDVGHTTFEAVNLNLADSDGKLTADIWTSKSGERKSTNWIASWWR